MPKGTGAVHIATQRRKYTGKDGVERVYESQLLRRSFREDGRVRNETLANLSVLPPAAITAIRAVLAGKSLVDRPGAHHHPLPAARAPRRRRGHREDVGIGRTAGAALGAPPGRDGADPGSRGGPGLELATISWWADTTLGADLDVCSVSTDEVYAAMDWLLGRQGGIEKQLAARHLDPTVNTSRIAMFDLSSSWVTGRHCELAARGYSRDGKKGCEQIEYGLLTDPTAARSRSGFSRAHRRPDRVHPRGDRGQGHLRVEAHDDGR